MISGWNPFEHTHDFEDHQHELEKQQMSHRDPDNQPIVDPGHKPLKDSGERQKFETGAVRDTSSGKGRYDLLQCHAILRVAQTLEKGAKKYSERNWEKGIPVSRFLDSGLRHTLQYLEGNRDEDHLAQAAWNLMCAIETEHWVKQGKLPKQLLLDFDREHNENYTSKPECKNVDIENKNVDIENKNQLDFIIKEFTGKDTYQCATLIHRWLQERYWTPVQEDFLQNLATAYKLTRAAKNG